MKWIYRIEIFRPTGNEVTVKFYAWADDNQMFTKHLTKEWCWAAHQSESVLGRKREYRRFGQREISKSQAALSENAK